MAQITYEYVEDAVRREFVLDRLRAIEAEHWRLSVDEAAGTAVPPGPAGFPAAAPSGDNARAERISQLEKAHEELSAKLAEIDGKTSGRRSKSS